MADLLHTLLCNVLYNKSTTSNGVRKKKQSGAVAVDCLPVTEFSTDQNKLAENVHYDMFAICIFATQQQRGEI